MTEPLNLDPIAARHNAATPGTWTVEWDRDDVSDIPFPTSIGPISYVEHHGERFTEDARFVEHAHDDTGLLLAEVRRLRELLRDTTVSLETIHDRLVFEEPDAADVLQVVIDRLNHRTAEGV